MTKRRKGRLSDYEPDWEADDYVSDFLSKTPHLLLLKPMMFSDIVTSLLAFQRC